MNKAPTVLYIEDNRANLRLMGKFLSLTNIHVLEAATAKIALEILKAKSPDLILLDIGLPDIDGISLVKLLREKSETAKVPIIAISANNLRSVREQCLSAGCDDFLSKPVSQSELIGMVNHYLLNYEGS
jgi:two-component system, cell cycle response regulator DivK